VQRGASIVADLVDVGTELLHQAFHHSQMVIILSCEVQRRTSFVICLIDVSAKLFDQTSYERQVTMPGCDDKWGIATVSCLVNVGTVFLDQESNNIQSSVYSRQTQGICADYDAPTAQIPPQPNEIAIDAHLGDHIICHFTDGLHLMAGFCLSWTLQTSLAQVRAVRRRQKMFENPTDVCERAIKE
jgi:hypothetical protein